MSILSDRYELSEPLGTGGMAEVYLGRDRVLGRTVAVKTLLQQYAGDPHFIERFRREAQNAASLNHPNVVSVYDTGSDDGKHFIVMEYVDGKTLRDVVREEGPLLPERVAEIGTEVCAGLQFAHQHGIIHRDVKPANIMLTSSGAVKVADFGIARAVSGDTVTQTAMVLGTAQYFSPEQAQSAPVDARSDVYALGVVLYEMLTRQVPFTGSSPVAIAYKHVKETPIVPSRLNPDVPPDLEAIVMKALAKNPDNRYQSAQDMGEDLQRALHGRPVQATPVMSDATGMINLASDETQIVERVPGAGLSRPETTPEDQRRRKGILLLVFIGLAILGVAAWALVGLLGGKELKSVPGVLGTKVSTAQEQLQARDFRVFVNDPIFSEQYQEGTVAAQDPEEGEKLEEGGVVTLTPSGGVELITVPKVVGKSQGAAKTDLEDARLALGDVTQVFSTQRAGTVVTQKPSENTQVPKGTKVNLEVSRGPQTVEVPDVVGLTEDDADAGLKIREFNVQVIRVDQGPECDQEVGRVCRTDPEAGDKVQRGSTVTIYVAKEPEPSPTPSPSPSPSPTDSEFPI